MATDPEPSAAPGGPVVTEERQEPRAARVTSLELFFDLVFIFAVTQVTTLLSSNPTWNGMLRALLLLSMLWWAWSAYAWLTNTLDPEEGGVRLVMFVAIAAMVIASLAAPRSFGEDAIVFAVAYIVVRAVHLLLFAIAGRGDPDLAHAVLMIVPTSFVGAALLLVAGFLHDGPQLAVWGAAVVVSYLGALAGHLRGFRISPEHFVERFGQVILIALGESIVAIGVGARGLALDASVIVAALLGVTVVTCIWWSYFDWLIYVAQATLAQATGTARAALARDAYSYLHLPMVAGIVLFAFGLKTALPDASQSLPLVPAVGLLGGVSLYLAAHVALRLRIGGGLGRGRPVAAVALLALIPAATAIPGSAALALVAATMVALIAYEAVRHRESRAFIRARRATLTREELSITEAGHRRDQGT
jgi:low temperature requirement protein LtrA